MFSILHNPAPTCNGYTYDIDTYRIYLASDDTQVAKVGLKGIMLYSQQIKYNCDKTLYILANYKYDYNIFMGHYIKMKGKIIESIPDMIRLIEYNDIELEEYILLILLNIDEDVYYMIPKLIELASRKYEELGPNCNGLNNCIGEGNKERGMNIIIIGDTKLLIAKSGIKAIPILRKERLKYKNNLVMLKYLDDIEYLIVNTKSVR